MGADTQAPLTRRYLWLEHALYGCFIFTIGLGWCFFSAASGKH